MAGQYPGPMVHRGHAGLCVTSDLLYFTATCLYGAGLVAVGPGAWVTNNPCPSLTLLAESTRRRKGWDERYIAPYMVARACKKRQRPPSRCSQSKYPRSATYISVSFIFFGVQAIDNRYSRPSAKYLSMQAKSCNTMQRTNPQHNSTLRDSRSTCVFSGNDWNAAVCTCGCS